jgi:peptidoglycan glycosyltransferase
MVIAALDPWRQRLRRLWRDFSEPGQAQLLLHQPGQPSRSIALHGGVYRLGRQADCEIPIDHQAVSRQHALL